MKIREGFVSNSSSSSFIIAFPKRPKNAKEIEKLFFASNKMFPDYMNEYEKDTANMYMYSSSVIAETLFFDISKKEPITEDQIIEEIRSGWFEGCPEYNWNGDSASHLFAENYKEKYGKSIYDAKKSSKEYKEYIRLSTQERDEEDRKWLEAAKSYFEVFRKDIQNKIVYSVEYGDRYGSFSGTLEHGEILEYPHDKRVKVIKISHH